MSQIIQLMPGSCWSPTGRPVAKPVANQVSCITMLASWADQAPWSLGWSQQCALRCVPAGRLEECLGCSFSVVGEGIMESMALYNLVARFEFSKFRAILPYPSDVFFFEGLNTFCNSVTKSHIPLLLLFDLHISPDTPTKIPTFLPPPSTPLSRWSSNGCHQICLTLHRGWIRKSWSWSRTRRSTPRPKLRWQLPWNLI